MSDSIGALGNDALFVSVAESPTKDQPQNTVDELSFDVCKDIGGWNLVVCFHVEVGKLAINLGCTLSIEPGGLNDDKPLEDK